MTKRELRSKIEAYDIYVPTRTSKDELEIILDVISADAGSRCLETAGVSEAATEDDIPF